MLALRRFVTCYVPFCFPVGEDTISPWQARWIRTRSTGFKCSLLIYTVGNRLLDSLIVDVIPSSRIHALSLCILETALKKKRNLRCALEASFLEYKRKETTATPPTPTGRATRPYPSTSET